MRMHPPQPLELIERRAGRGRAAFRLLTAERSDEIFPILLEEIVSTGCPRAMVATLDFDSGEVKVVAALNCNRSFQHRFNTGMWQGDNPVVSVLNAMKPAVLPKLGTDGRPLYCYPILYRNRTLCWEAERSAREDCLAVQNFHRPGKLDLQEQVCRTCGMRSYAGLVIAELPRRSNERQIQAVGDLVQLANSYLSRLFKVDHYYNRMRDADVTIAQMQTLMQSMADPVILTDAQHRVIAQNRAAERFFKLPAEVTEGAARAVEFNNLLFSAALSSMALSGTGEAHRDLTLVDVIEGEEVLFEAVTAHSQSQDGLRTGLVTVMRDVTDLRRADEEFRGNMQKLREAEEVVRQDRDRLNLVIENVGDPIIVADSAAKVVLADPLAQALFGRVGEEDPAADPKLVKNQIVLDSYLQNFTFSFEAKLSSSLRLYHPETRTMLDYDTRSGKIYDKRGQVAYTITVLRDLSSMRKLEQLKMERRMLEMEKFAATGRLAGTIAHEINNPMEAIKNSIFLLKGQVSKRGEPVYDILRSETERVARIVRQMLGLYRHSEQVGPVDINSVVEDTLALFTRQLERGGIEVRKELGKLPMIVGSGDQVRQVVSNLVVNAKDGMLAAAEHNGNMAWNPILHLRTRHLPAPDGIHGFVRILVADNGTGIPPEMLQTVFEPFFSTKGEKGTGLGLWIVKGIVENHGGKMRVRSQVGKGTTFKIDLPVVR